MRTSTCLRAAASAVLTSALAAVLVAPPAPADPPPIGTLAGVGSDSTQDVMQAISVDSGGRIENWHASRLVNGQIAVHDDIVVKGTAITRPSGSADGREALFRSMGANRSTSWASSPVPVSSGIIGFARSSDQPPSVELSASGDVYYVPFALDAMTFATDDQPIALLNGVSLTLAQLNALYEDCQPVAVPGGTLNPSQPGGNVDLFVPQTPGRPHGEETWDRGIAPAGYGPCVLHRYDGITGQPVSSGGVAVREDDSGPTSLNPAAIVPFSVASWVAQTNGVAPNRLRGATLHRINGVIPTLGTPPNEATNRAFPFTAPVFNVVPAAQISGPPNTATELAFVGPSSAVCANEATITDYGFIALSENTTDPWTCGATFTRAYPGLLP